MFSSHTIYTLSLILTVFKYWDVPVLLVAMLFNQIVIIFLIVAARKHYTVDVWTALYVVPMLWFTLEAYHKDINHKDETLSAASIQQFYGINIDSMKETAELSANNTSHKFSTLYDEVDLECGSSLHKVMYCGQSM